MAAQRVERERIAVKGAAAVEVELKYTRHGPLIWEDRAGHRAIALRWVGTEPGTAGYLGSASLARVPNWGEFLATAERRALFDAGPVERGGDAYTPNATGGANFRQQSGASYRHVFDLAEWDRGVFTNAPGQSGQPGSPHYADLLKLWADGSYAPLAYTRHAIRRNLAHRLVLEPAQR